MGMNGHPFLALTKEGVKEIKKNINTASLFRKTFLQTKDQVDSWISSGVLVPVPKDMAGGYTHEVHKRNFLMLQAAGNVFQITGEEVYSKHIYSVFKAYADLYPMLDIHPATRSYAPGKLFWQCLNDANWLVYSSQAYDCIYETLTESEREYLEIKLFRPFADYISISNPSFFNRVHNHSTWGIAAVGMIALVMGDEELLNRALYGIKDMGAITGVDNDGGTIETSKKAGFFAQLDGAFSPDGYYSEGPYYQRYAMSPFIMFAQALENVKPGLKIFEYRENLLKKALKTLVNLTDSKGRFFPINDSQKGMSYTSRELVAAVDVIYYYCGRDKTLLSIAEEQDRVQLDQTGMAVAKDIIANKALPFIRKSIEFKDGPSGKEGGVSILRGGEFSCFFKYGVQGMGHGHFDRLSYSLYFDDTEILQDYGSARWVNIDQKSGGVYLKENKTWAKQTIAHNTVVINEKSQFEGNTQKGDQFPSEAFYFDVSNPEIQIASAKDTNAFEGVKQHRTLFLVNDDVFTQPILIDIFTILSDTLQTIDLPFHFGSQVMTSSVDLNVSLSELHTLGTKNGYQHLWLEGQGKADSGHFEISWFTNGLFTTQYGLSETTDKIIFARIGANDPNFNLRRDPLHIHRKENKHDPVFINVISCHGVYDPVEEIPISSNGPKVKIKLLLHNESYTIAEIITGGINKYTAMIANSDTTANNANKVLIGNTIFEWRNPVYLKKEKL